MKQTSAIVIMGVLLMGAAVGGYCVGTVSQASRIAQLQSQIYDLTSQIATLSSGEPSILAVRFSPGGDCAAQVNYWLSRANHTVHVLIYSFTLDSIGDAVLATYSRGVDVKVVFEKSQVSQYSELFRLAAAGVPVRNDTNPDFMHEKVAIIDGYIVLVGSFNWSAAAENDNNEVLLVIRSTDLATTLEREFQRVWTTGR
jgi:phosphatidylserine/phosphatidylglycerophosphate/cardiolipin synthase-like enzyme